MDDIKYKSTDTVMSEYQWLRKGFIVKDTAVGIDGWNNRFCTYPLFRFTADEVYEDTKQAKKRLSKIRHEYYIAAREKKKYWDWFEEFREDMKTQYQWFHEENRVPLETAKWYNGESLNKRYNTSSFGSDYYCHRDDTKAIVKPAIWDGEYYRYCKVMIDDGVTLWYGLVLSPKSVNDAIDSIINKYNANEKVVASLEERDPIYLPHQTNHMLRHSYCTRMIEKCCEPNSGIDVKIVQYLMGHNDAKTTLDIYTDVHEDFVKQTMSRFAGQIYLG